MAVFARAILHTARKTTAQPTKNQLGAVGEHLVMDPFAVDDGAFAAFVDDAIAAGHRFQAAQKRRQIVVGDADVVDDAASHRDGLAVQGGAQHRGVAAGEDQFSHGVVVRRRR